MGFSKEADFEEALIKVLTEKGWKDAEGSGNNLLKRPTEEDLIQNWADILFANNNTIDRLNDCPLTKGEMRQIIEQLTDLRTPYSINGFINGKTISVKRDNPADELHFGKEISLSNFDRMEISGGRSRYQIAQQPIFNTKSKMLNDRRGDLMLLINGMPVFHIELKKSGVHVSEAYHQIEKYAHEGVYSGIYSLVQVFVAMNPEETVYFANPGPDGTFNEKFYFHWADFNNEQINDWKDVASTLLSIPMAHQMIGFYTVADGSDSTLKVMRSYQYFAANGISDRVSKHKWDDESQRGGYVWHTTGSGKTMTSFKSAQLIANSGDADKVVFLTDRIELGTQSLEAYKNFAGDNESVQATENTRVLIGKLKSTNYQDTLIVTSIQKMSNIEAEDGGINARDIELMNRKRIVFIVDEAHRSTFGDMLLTIKRTFPRALFFGFTGTPIQDENQKKDSTTSTVFGNEIHRYSIADGIRDGNVLGFDPYKVQTFAENDVRKAVAINQAKAKAESDAVYDPKKRKMFYHFMEEVPMAGYRNPDGSYEKGIEDYLPNSQYESDEHRTKVVEDITGSWFTVSKGNRFHAIFATSSIPEAIAYYRMFKEKAPGLKTTCLFDPSIDNRGDGSYKEDGLVEILSDYNDMFGMDFTIPTHALFKKDVSLRLAHKEPYRRVERSPGQRLDLLIVVDQMLTGFDSKWINALYLDKVLEYENIIQAFSRTNRVFDNEKRFGMIKYYRKPFTMERNIADAVKLYSGDKPFGLFVEKLPANLEKMNVIFVEIKDLFKNAGVNNFSKLPEEPIVVGKFVSLFNDFTQCLDSAEVQGFKWDRMTYEFTDDDTGKSTEVKMIFDERDYHTLVQRYKEIERPETPPTGEEPPEAPYDLKGYIISINTDKIDSDYMNSRFDKYMEELSCGASEEEVESALNELHKSFAVLSREDQKYANIFLHDVQSGSAVIRDGMNLRDYINEYEQNTREGQIRKLTEALGLDADKLKEMMSLNLNDKNINEFGRLDELKKTVDKTKARAYFEESEGVKLNPPKVNIRIDQLLRNFIINNGFDL